jgi:hypothetical protein
LGLLLANSSARGDDNENDIELNKDHPTYNNFKSYMLQQKDREYVSGLSYVVSGGIATIGGVIAYETSTDPIAKAVFSLSQSIGIAAIGYGALDWYNGNDYSSVFYALEHTRLTALERDRFMEKFFIKEKQRERQARIIKAVTHTLVAALNGYYAVRENNKDLKAAFYFIGGVNALVAISYTF